MGLAASAQVTCICEASVKVCEPCCSRSTASKRKHDQVVGFVNGEEAGDITPGGGTDESVDC